MDNAFKNRKRMSIEDARKIMSKGGLIRHLLDNGDGTFSVMGHINCEHCDYCDLENEWWEARRKEGMSYEERQTLVVPAMTPQEDPYARQKIRFPENYGIHAIS